MHELEYEKFLSDIMTIEKSKVPIEVINKFTETYKLINTTVYIVELSDDDKIEEGNIAGFEVVGDEINLYVNFGHTVAKISLNDVGNTLFTTLEDAENKLREKDYVKVVRCINCRYYDDEYENIAGNHMCTRHRYCVKPDGYCSYGNQRLEY